MTIVTVFRSRLRPGVDEEYQRVAGEMSRLVRTMGGFIDERFYVSPDGERVTIVRFADHDSQRTWASEPAHVAAQRRGREEFYAWYDISVAEQTYARTFFGPGPSD
ncbi:MAG TPA: antibiotic biosynthesis monooxygenase [Acidimicrobiales bacterium]|nr:antibiotic biosynthesis monooxygenase [Acidimicrobiales bacterium]